MMIYLYSRALGSIEPFPIAKENLTRLLKKFVAFSVDYWTFWMELNQKPQISIKCSKIIEFEKAFIICFSFSNREIHECKYSKVDFDNVKMKFEMLLLTNNENIVIDSAKLDMKFLSTLIGSSFIKESIQLEIMKIFNPTPAARSDEIISNRPVNMNRSNYPCLNKLRPPFE